MTTEGEETGATRPRRKRKGPMRLISRTLQKAWDGNFFSEAAEAGFWQALSLAPLMLGLLGLLGYVSDWFGQDVAKSVADEIVKFVEKVFSDSVVENIVKPTVNDMLTDGKAAIASVGILIALWAGSSAMSSFVDAITVAHDQYGVRHAVWQRIFALLLYMASLVLLIVGLPLIAVGPELLPRFFPESARDDVTAWVSVLYYPTLGVLIVLALATLYKVALPRKLPWHRGLPGAILAMAIFLLASTGLRFYLQAITASGFTYGALATFVAFLLFLFFLGMAIIVGAHFNSAIQELWPAKPTRRERRRWRRLEMERTSKSLQSGDEPKGVWERATGPLRRPRKPPKAEPEPPAAAAEPAEAAKPSPEPRPKQEQEPADERTQSLSSPPGGKPS